MTPKQIGKSVPPVQLSVRDRQAVLRRVLAALQKRFYASEKLNDEWKATVERHRPQIAGAGNTDSFEEAMNRLLEALHSSHLGFFHASARRASSRAALSANYLAIETSFGRRWIFQDVHTGGAAAIAGIEPGDILLSVAGREINPPEHPVFAMGQRIELEIVGRNDQQRVVTLDVAQPKGKKLHYVNPTLVESKHLGNGLGYLKVAAFPGMIGVDVANEISDAVQKLGNVERLIIDLRGNTGGGLGALRVMSLLTSGKVPVGFALDRCRAGVNLESEKHRFPRFSRIPASKNAIWPLALKYGPAMATRKPIVLETEALGDKPFHGRIVLLVDRHTASAAEMIVAFAKENDLATVVGENTAGRLLSATSVKVGHGYRLALPTGAYYTWKGQTLEGAPIKVDQPVAFDWRQRRTGVDGQFLRAVEIIRSDSNGQVG